jgi:enoyl-CoA hydratase/carnithine racemase
VDLSFDTTEDAAVARTLELSDKVFSTADCREGVRAFFAKEKPRFSHA